MDQSTRQPKLLKDYAPPNYLVDTVELDFALDPKATRVKSKLRLRPNPKADAAGRPLALDGEGLVLQSLERAGPALHRRDRDLVRSRGEHGAVWPLSLARHLLHPVRAGRLSPRHFFSRPP